MVVSFLKNFKKSVDILRTVWYNIYRKRKERGEKMILKKRKQKEPTFIKKVDKWQTEMYLYKLNQERQAQR